MHVLYDGVVSFFSFQMLLARMDLISFRRKEWAWGEVKCLNLPFPSPLLGVSPADSPWSVLRAHNKGIFKMATNGDKKRESNGVILRYRQGCCLMGARSPGGPKLRVRATKFLFKEPGGRLSIDFPFSSNDFNFLVTLFHWRKIYPV